MATLANFCKDGLSAHLQKLIFRGVPLIPLVFNQKTIFQPEVVENNFVWSEAMNKRRKRNLEQKFFISDKEAELLKIKMEEAGVRNKSAYLRKMALDGYIIKQDFTPVKDVIGELNRIGNNLNQMTKIANTYGDVYLTELQSIREGIDKIWRQLSLRV